jgi:hypothetical protein
MSWLSTKDLNAPLLPVNRATYVYYFLQRQEVTKAYQKDWQRTTRQTDQTFRAECNKRARLGMQRLRDQRKAQREQEQNDKQEARNQDAAKPT